MAEFKEDNPDELHIIPEIEFHHGDFLKANILDADVMYLNSCLYSQEMMDIIGELPLKPGTIAFSVTLHFENSPSWEVLECEKRGMSWCPTEVYISRKK